MKKEHVTAEVAIMFDEFWSVYPKRVNGGRYEAKQVFNKLITKELVPCDEIINGARGYAEHCRESKKLNTEFVAMAKTWLNQRRWEDYGIEQKPLLSTDKEAELLERYRKRRIREGWENGKAAKAQEDFSGSTPNRDDAA